MTAARSRKFTGNTLPELLEQAALARPDAIAVVHGADTLTYRELLESSLDTAFYLAHLGVGPDDRVGVLLEPALELITAVWGIAHSGGAYLPLSPDYPDERLRYIVQDSGLTVVLTREELRERVSELGGPALRIVTPEDVHEFTKAAGEHGDDKTPAPVRPQNLAYVIYTSGSTGKPKGVLIEQRSVTHQMKWLAETWGLGPESVVLQKTPISFDAAQWEILSPACGSRVVMPEPGVHRDPARLIETVTAYGVTTLQCVPTLLQALVENDEFNRCASLRQVFSGGEPLSRALARKLLDALPDSTLVNLYGPTECTINTSAFAVDRARLGDGPQSVPIGTPVAGTRYHILGPKGRELGVGETGELHVSGVQLARGYLGRPDLTAERFIGNPFDSTAPHARLYRTGDLAQWNPDGTVQFVGRADNQVKLRGFRIELDEIRLAVEAHDWVRNAAVVVRTEPRTGFEHLVACVELSPREAVLMDQGSHCAHHLSKESKLQVRAQLSTPGTRTDTELAGRPALALPGATATPEQRRRAFARKTYRFYHGGTPRVRDLLDALSRRVPAAAPRRPETLSPAELGTILREFGPHTSNERLLEKYAYASPGALYATQLLVEVTGGVAGLAPGVHYYHPQRHELVLVSEPAPREAPDGLTLHFVGRTRALEPVYRNNIREVLGIETGHMLGLLDEVLPAHGLGLRELPAAGGCRDRLGCAPDDRHLGSFVLAPHSPSRVLDRVDLYVQIHPGGAMELPPGQYRYRDGRLERISDDLVLKRHVVAINQQVYERASFGVTVVSRTTDGWAGYTDLGRVLQHLQLNTAGLGFMSAGYSSRTGHDLPAARRMNAVLTEAGLRTGPSYFFVGGKVSADQPAHEGMAEDVVHMQGPAEMIMEDLAGFLPAFMRPNRLLVLERLPLTANGKLDMNALTQHVDRALATDDRPVVLPRNPAEERLCGLWRAALRRDVVSVRDDFFACGGNSLIAVALVHRVNRAFGASLPLQILFDCPTVERLAERLTAAHEQPSPRLVSLRTTGREPLGEEGPGRPVFCWPGLGGYAMNLRALAVRSAGPTPARPFYGVQAQGLNEGETPCADLEATATADVRAIRRVQPTGPYTLWGYSFGARVAFEAARQLEQAGEEVDRLLLLAPGSPRTSGPESWLASGADFADVTFRTVLFSVFAGAVSGSLLAECLRVAVDEESFTRFVIDRFRGLSAHTVRRIVHVACHTYGWTPRPRPVAAPVTVLTARDDEESFLDRAPFLGLVTPTVVRLDTDHFGALREPGVDELTAIIRRISGTTAETRPGSCPM